MVKPVVDFKVNDTNHIVQLDKLNISQLEKAFKLKTNSIGKYVTHINESTKEKFQKIVARFAHLFKLQWLNDNKCKVVVKNKFQTLESNLRTYYSGQITTAEGAKTHLDSLQKGHQKLEAIANLFQKTVIYDEIKKELHIKEWENLIEEAKQKISLPPPPPAKAPPKPIDKKPAEDVLDTLSTPPPSGTDAPPPPPPKVNKPPVTTLIKLPPLEPVVPLNKELINKVKAELDEKVPEEDKDWDTDVSFICENDGTEGCSVEFKSDDEKSTLTIKHPDGRKFIEEKNLTGHVTARNFAKDGFDEKGRTYAGFDQKGFNENGFDARGYDEEGYDAQGLDKDRYNRAGVNPSGYNKHTGLYETPKTPGVGTATVDKAAEIVLINKVWEILNTDEAKALVTVKKLLLENTTPEQLYDVIRSRYEPFLIKQNAPDGLFGKAGVKVPLLFEE